MAYNTGNLKNVYNFTKEQCVAAAAAAAAAARASPRRARPPCRAAPQLSALA